MPNSSHGFLWQDETLTQKQRMQIIQKNAQTAFSAGMQAWAEGAHHKAWDWLERAYRLAPYNGHVMFALILARQAVHDSDGAQIVLNDLLKKYDFQEGWVLLHHIWSARGYKAGAEHTISHLLSNFASTPEIECLAKAFSKKYKKAWCSIEHTGQLHWGGMAVGCVPTLFYNSKKVVPYQVGKDWFCPDGWQLAEKIEIKNSGNQHVLGSPLQVKRILQCEGFVQEQENTLSGWVWYPNAPEIDPTICLKTSTGQEIFRIHTVQKGQPSHSERPVAQYRTFSVPPENLPQGWVHIVTSHGEALSGSPLVVRRKGQEAAFLAECLSQNRKTIKWGVKEKGIDIWPFFSIPALGLTSAMPDVSGQKAPLAVIIPVYRHYAITMACLHSVQETLHGKAVKVVVVNDASPEFEVVAGVENFCKKHNFIFISHSINKGFPAAINTGLRAVPGHDVILLNSDTLVPQGWATALRHIAYEGAATGTVTPLSNKGGLGSYPSVEQENPMPTVPEMKRIVAAVHLANKGRSATLPTGNGFCLYIRHDCLKQTGFLREDIFAQGYGEENDFCLRAHALGWQHKAALDVYVGHVGAVSFGQSRQALMHRNESLLEQLHPGYHHKIEEWIKADPLWQARRRIDLVRFRTFGVCKTDKPKAVLCITHAQGGGVEYVVQQRVAFYQKRFVRALILRPTPQGCLLEDPHYKKHFPSLFFRLPAELPLLQKVLQAEGLQQVEIHHITGYPPCVYDFVQSMAVPFTLFIHDYAFFCQRVSLLGPNGTYCGEPPPHVCTQCVALAGEHVGGALSVPMYLERSHHFLKAARRVYAPSQDTAARMARHFSGVRFMVRPPQNDKDLPPLLPIVVGEASDRAELPASGILAAPHGPKNSVRVRLCVIGAIGQEKGYDVLYQAALDAAWRNLPLEFVLVGHTPNDQLLLNTGRVFITGHYKQENALQLIQSFKCHAAFLPSIWPETWCLTLGLAWQAGLPAFVFDYGAPAERVRQTRRGWLLNAQLRGSDLNQVLIKTVLGCRNNNDGKKQSPFIKI